MKIIDTGIVFRNPKPHVFSVHAYFPSLVKLGNGDLLCSLTLGEAFESTDLHSYLARSTDNAATWTFQQEMFARKSGGVFSDSCRITSLGSGEIAAFIIRHNRSEHAKDGLANPENVGFVPTELLLSRSRDYGQTFTEPEPLEPDLVGPEFELCSPITVLNDGTWLLPTSTWKDWNGFAADGARMVALVSEDGGKTWPRHLEVMNSVEAGIIYWESKIVQLHDSRLLAVAWAYDELAGQDLPNHYSLSSDNGESWTEPVSMGIAGQTLTPLVLPSGEVLCVYRRIDQPGLWASKCTVKEDSFEVVESLPLWGCNAAGLTGTSDNMQANFAVLRFGAPCLTLLDSDTVLAGFWCYEDCVSNIRWIKIEVRSKK